MFQRKETIIISNVDKESLNRLFDRLYLQLDDFQYDKGGNPNVNEKTTSFYSETIDKNISIKSYLVKMDCVNKKESGIIILIKISERLFNVQS